MDRRKFIKQFALGTIGLGFIESFWFERYVIDWNYFDISKSADKIKFIQLSDLHYTGLKYFHKSIAKKINKIKPDIIFFTGDTLDKNENTEKLENFLKLIDISIPKFAITGNWEYWGKIDLTKLKKIYKQYNCELLINENRKITIKNRAISVIGVDDFIGGNADFKKSIQNIASTKTNIILSHCPAYTDFILSEKKDLNIDLILSGHTHGGQINLFGFVPFKPKGSGKYLKGWYDKMYVSKGIGTSILPFRFGARAEVTEMDI